MFVATPTHMPLPLRVKQYDAVVWRDTDLTPFAALLQRFILISRTLQLVISFLHQME